MPDDQQLNRDAAREREIYDQKRVAQYAAYVEAWIHTRMERDRSLLTLSAGAIGILFTLISTIGVPSIESLVLHILALLFFVTCVSCLVAVFGRNATHLGKCIQNENSSPDPILTILDNVAVASFMAGVILSSVIGISIATTKYSEREKNMDDNSLNSSSEMIKSLNDIQVTKPVMVEPSRNEGASVNNILQETAPPPPKTTSEK